jgi:hypothetical protein
MPEYIGYNRFLDKFEINCKKFFTTVDTINKKLNEKILIKFNYEYNLEENSKNKENVYKFFIGVEYEQYNSYVNEYNTLSHKIYFIKYTNDDKVYLNDILNKKNIYGSINDIIYYINITMNMYSLLMKLSTSFNIIDFDLKKYIYKFNDVDSFIDYIKNNDDNIFNIFLEKIRKNELSKIIVNKYQYLVHASNFDLI